MTSPVVERSTERDLEGSKLYFLEQTGYSDDELIAWNHKTMKFAMRNGGLYQLTGDEIEHLGGPSPDPGERL
jgi:hypothetical protein